MGCELAVDGSADVRAVGGVNPEDFTARGPGLAGVLRQDLDSEMLCKMVCSAGLLACEEGDVMLSQEGLAIDGDKRLAGERTEVSFTSELTRCPGLSQALGVGLTIIVDFHGVFLGIN